VLQNKFPFLYKKLQENEKIKFKNPSWVKLQNTKLQSKATQKSLKQILISFDGITQIPNMPPTFNQIPGSYMSVDSGISVKVQKKYCDFTGMNAYYFHKGSGLRYSNMEQFEKIDRMGNSKIEEYLNIRKASTAVK